MTEADVKTKVDGMIGAMNEPRDDIPRKALKPDYTDRQGRAFDKNIHMVGDDGKPLLTARKKLRMKGNRGRKTGEKKEGSTLGGLTKDNRRVETPYDPHDQAIGLMNTYFMFCNKIGGEKMKPTEQEFQACVMGCEGLCAQHPDLKIPPWAQLSLALGIYHVQRIEINTTKRWTFRIWDKFTGRGKRATQSNSGKNGKRENESGNTDGSSVQS